MYRRRLPFRIFENIEARRKSIYNVSILTAMRWVIEEWSACPDHVVKNCFLHYFKQSGLYVGVTPDDEEDTLNSIARDATENNAAFTRAGLQNLLNHSDENNVTEELSLEMQGKEVAAVPETYKEAVEASDLDGGEEEEESPEMQLK